MKEFLYRVWLTVLLIAVAMMVARAAFSQPEGSMGTYPLPRIVGMSDRKPAVRTPPPVSIEVWPKIAIPNPYKSTTFHTRWKIEPHRDNRSYTLSMDCGEYHSSSQGLDGENDAKTRDRFDDLRVVEFCVFRACVYRTGGKQFCVEQKISTPEEPP